VLKCFGGQGASLSWWHGAWGFSSDRGWVTCYGVFAPIALEGAAVARHAARGAGEAVAAALLPRRTALRGAGSGAAGGQDGEGGSVLGGGEGRGEDERKQRERDGRGGGGSGGAGWGHDARRGGTEVFGV